MAFLHWRFLKWLSCKIIKILKWHIWGWPALNPTTSIPPGRVHVREVFCSSLLSGPQNPGRQRQRLRISD